MYIPAWPVLSPRQMLPLNGRAALPFPLNDGHGTYFHMARNGIYHLFRALLGIQAGGTVLVPDYHHGVEVQAIRAAGATIRYYAVNRHLEPDLDEIARLCRASPRALYVIHFLGWPQPIHDLATLCRERDILLIEDCALALLSRAGQKPLGTFGEYAIFCLYKTLPVPDGGLLVQNGGASADFGHLALQTWGTAPVVGRSLGLMLEWVHSRSDMLGSTLGLPKTAVKQLLYGLGVERMPAGAAELDLAHVNLGMSPLCRRLLRHFDYDQIRQRRRRNFLLMQEKLAGRTVFLRTELDEGVCPLVFPILVPDKPAVARALRQRGIGALEWWSVGVPDSSRDFSADSTFLRQHLLGLPVHQDITPSQVEFMAEQVLSLPAALLGVEGRPWR